MDKKGYLSLLRSELKKAGITEIDDILEEYRTHFELKQKKGKTEEEIARKLASPEYIANEYAQSLNITSNNEKFSKITMSIGLGFIDVIMFMVLIIFVGWVIVLGAFSLILLVLSFLLFTNLNIANLIPFIPYYGKLLIGISSLSLCIASFIGTTYCYIYVRQWIRVYLRWHKNILNNRVYPKLSLIPERLTSSIKPRLLMMITFVTSGSFLIISMIIMMIDTNSFEFWHEWNWFQ